MDQDELDPQADTAGLAPDMDASLDPTPDTAIGEPHGTDSVASTAPDVPSRPREVIKGIHPELLCTCEECEPDHVELQWFSVDEARKVKGTAMLYCARSSRKFFTPVPDLQAFLTANPVKGRRNQHQQPTA